MLLKGERNMLKWFEENGLTFARYILVMSLLVYMSINFIKIGLSLEEIGKLLILMK
jgi:hypothetical protein